MRTSAMGRTIHRREMFSENGVRVVADLTVMSSDQRVFSATGTTERICQVHRHQTEARSRKRRRVPAEMGIPSGGNGRFCAETGIPAYGTGVSAENSPFQRWECAILSRIVHSIVWNGRFGSEMPIPERGKGISAANSRFPSGECAILSRIDHSTVENRCFGSETCDP